MKGSDGVTDAPTRRPSFTCPRCGMKSSHPKDIEEGYCGNCRAWTRSTTAKAAPVRPTAAARDSRDAPLDRDEYAEHLRARADGSRYGEAMVVAALLEELAAVYPGELIAEVATDLARRLQTRAGMSR